MIIKNNKIDICGIGNALMDVLVQTEKDAPEFYQRHGIRKGTMMLVDNDQWQAVSDDLKNGTREIKTGGSGANTLAIAAILGAKAGLMAMVGGDDTGEKYRELYARLCPHSRIVANAKDVTGRCLSVISPDAERTMFTCLGASNSLTAEQIDHDLIKNSSILHVTGYLLTGGSIAQAAFAALTTAKANDVVVSFDVSDVFVIENFKEAVHRVIDEYADIVFANEMESEALYGSIDHTRKNLKDRCELTVLKFGKAGSEIIGDSVFSVKACQADAVDTTGAGDSYAGAFLAACLRGLSMDAAGAVAARVAAQVVSQTGAVLDTDAAVRDDLKELGFVR